MRKERTSSSPVAFSIAVNTSSSLSLLASRVARSASARLRDTSWLLASAVCFFPRYSVALAVCAAMRCSRESTEVERLLSEDRRVMVERSASVMVRGEDLAERGGANLITCERSINGLADTSKSRERDGPAYLALPDAEAAIAQVLGEHLAVLFAQLDAFQAQPLCSCMPRLDSVKPLHCVRV